MRLQSRPEAINVEEQGRQGICAEPAGSRVARADDAARAAGEGSLPWNLQLLPRTVRQYQQGEDRVSRSRASAASAKLTLGLASISERLEARGACRIVAETRGSPPDRRLSRWTKEHAAPLRLNGCCHC